MRRLTIVAVVLLTALLAATPAQAIDFPMAATPAQAIDFPFFQELSPAELAQVSPTPTTYETGTFDFSGSGTVEGQVVPTNES